MVKFMCDFLIYRGPHWMDEDDGGITKYEALQIFIDNYKSGTLTPAQKYRVIRRLVNMSSDVQLTKIVNLLLANGIVLKPIETKRELLNKLDFAVNNWVNLSTERKANIINWADDVIDKIPVSVVQELKNTLTIKHTGRYQQGDIVEAREDNAPRGSKEETAFIFLSISDLTFATGKQYAGAAPNSIYMCDYRIDLTGLTPDVNSTIILNRSEALPRLVTK